MSFFQSVVMNVADLDRSIDFYKEVFSFALIARKDQLAAMNAPGNDRPQVIVLRSVSATSSRRISGGGHVGIRALILEVDSQDELERVAAELDKRGTLMGRHGDDATWTAVSGRDPDQIALVAGTSLTDEPIRPEAWEPLHMALYAFGE
jgi:catechol 2,3-dioxygenase-like lactoylglutathione lyase family enzyme